MELIICIKMDFALNNLLRFICNKNPNNQQTNQFLRKGICKFVNNLIFANKIYFEVWINKIIIKVCSLCFHLLLGFKY